MSRRLHRGDLLPEILVSPPGPKARAASARLRAAEAPGINTLYQDHDNIVWSEALGSNVLDVDGNRYIDLTSGFGVASIGHRHPKVVEALAQQGQRLIHALGDAIGHGLRIDLAERLQELVPVDSPQVYFAISGADAVEIALKTAWLATGRQKILVFDPSYHGMTFGALAATSRPAFRGPFVDHLTTHLERLPFGCEMDRIHDTLRSQHFAAVIVEPIVGREGVLIPPSGWLKSLAEACRRSETLLIADEIFTGFGRTGKSFAVDHEGVRPDLLCCGKALAGGLPIGAVVGRRDLMQSWRTGGEAMHTATFVAHPLACATALATLEVLYDSELSERASRLESEYFPRVRAFERLSGVDSVRGRGLLWGLELDHPQRAAQCVQRAWSKGLLMLAGGPEGRVAQLVPPLVIHRHQLDHTLECLESILTSDTDP